VTYRRRYYAHEDDAHAALTVLESFGHRAGLIPTKVAAVQEGGGDHTEYEVWCVCGDPPVIRPRPDPEPDEHDRGRSTIWDELHERDY
jgi:hypothetical protein